MGLGSREAEHTRDGRVFFFVSVRNKPEAFGNSVGAMNAAIKKAAYFFLAFRFPKGRAFCKNWF